MVLYRMPPCMRMGAAYVQWLTVAPITAAECCQWRRARLEAALAGFYNACTSDPAVMRSVTSADTPDWLPCPISWALSPGA